MMNVKTKLSPCCGAEMWKEGSEGFICTECNIVVVPQNPLEDLLTCKRRDFLTAQCSRGHKFDAHQSLTDKAFLQCECPIADALGACGELLTIIYKQSPFIESDVMQ